MREVVLNRCGGANGIMPWLCNRFELTEIQCSSTMPERGIFPLETDSDTSSQVEQ
jgi:hypothetical protein